jgi:LPPG:FO 2-phospho-L-lactate transferase
LVSRSVVVLAGGTGGAKLAAGLYDLLGPDELTVIANTGDDIEIYGVHVSPDPDLVTYWLAGIIDERGWGIAGDTFSRADGWFQLGDRDMELCRVRTAAMEGGATQTEAHAAVVAELGVRAAVLPMSDQPVRTRVRTPAGWRPFQEFMIVDRAAAPILEVAFDGVDAAVPSPESTKAVAEADVVIVGPSNPIISIGTILALPGMRDALRDAAAPVVAVSPFVGGRAVKGPTDAFMEHAGLERSAAGIAKAYASFIDRIVADEPVPGHDVLVIDTLMDDAAARRRVADQVLASVNR